MGCIWGKWIQRVKVCPADLVLCYPGYSNGMMFSIETLAGCVTLDLTTKILVVRSKVPHSLHQPQQLLL